MLSLIADSTGALAVGIHSATLGPHRDLLSCALDKLKLGNNQAARTLTAELLEQLSQGRPVHLILHSRGGLTGSRAIADAIKTLRESGLSAGEVEKRLSRMHVETFGAAATRYPDGPKYTHYLNTADPIPYRWGFASSSRLKNLAPHPGKGARVVTFTESQAPHSFQTYWTYRERWMQREQGRPTLRSWQGDFTR